ncbi:sulfate adenylyltransferase [Campylobacter sp. MIT 99-7217]|uniref:sulfate adenylyltransferase n=1 Tax=Campylobacter sp. MIT 99-7217 TaxID=535091 RepID=UPI0011594784|nr:sulfate adenylyltransferase [Campylobacter sp. MIT 99-7217]TQR32396.1 sulfate adenylyltransferase [Campylobacter sp. MIT 99-7217]
MDSQRKNKNIILQKSEYELLCLIKEQMLGTCTRLINEKEKDEFIKYGKIDGKKAPYALTFAPKFDDRVVLHARKGDILNLVCEGRVVGELKLESKFKNNKQVTNIFEPHICSLDNVGKICISGEFEIFDSHIKKIKEEFNEVKQRLNAQRITALVTSLDPLHRGHERIFSWTIDKADLVVIFLIESYEENGFDFELKKAYLDQVIQNYFPHEHIFVFPLRHIDIFHAHLNPALEGVIAKSLGCSKMIVGQNHTGLGMHYDQNQAKTILDEFARDYGIEVVILPEFVFCEKCKILVSTKSCPHGAHHHAKFNARSLKELLRHGIIPPAIFMREEVSSIILSQIFPNRFKNMQRIYNDLFPTGAILEHKKDEEFYGQLLRLHQAHFVV